MVGPWFTSKVYCVLDISLGNWLYRSYQYQTDTYSLVFRPLKWHLSVGFSSVCQTSISMGVAAPYSIYKVLYTSRGGERWGGEHLGFQWNWTITGNRLDVGRKQ